ncbi:MAG TPA: cytochrome c oxidase assembly factor Coa1 family protein [Thermoguttaceae bacterium]|nr:cytochrome c oxidase assembly factor Coa1 family protein [Thermoguttaceae bacterium]HPP52397.1 cytochrome c oxidase assembly factor Coa1 family protein [Thermoguttaceae bacterium]
MDDTNAKSGENVSAGTASVQARPMGWKLLVGLLVTALVGMVAGFVGFWLVVLQPKSAEPYRMALELVQKDLQVQKALGEPIEEASWYLPPSGEMELEGGQGRAFYSFDVKGPNGMANVRVEARYLNGQWGLTLLDVTVAATGHRIRIDTSSAGPGDEAPKWKP